MVKTTLKHFNYISNNIGCERIKIIDNNYD